VWEYLSLPNGIYVILTTQKNLDEDPVLPYGAHDNITGDLP
jgi:hypothetical protein